MFFTKLLQNGLTLLFGDKSKDPSQDDFSYNLLMPHAIPVTIEDIDTLKEACLQMKEISYVLLIAAEIFSHLDGISTEQKGALNLTKEQTTDLMIDYINWAQRCENIRKNSALVGSIDQSAARLAILDITSRFSQMLQVCAPASISICVMNAVGSVDRGDEIENRLNTAMQKGMEMSVSLQALLHKSYNFATPSTATPSQAPAI